MWQLRCIATWRPAVVALVVLGCFRPNLCCSCAQTAISELSKFQHHCWQQPLVQHHHHCNTDWVSAVCHWRLSSENSRSMLEVETLVMCWVVNMIRVIKSSDSHSQWNLWCLHLTTCVCCVTTCLAMIWLHHLFTSDMTDIIHWDDVVCQDCWCIRLLVTFQMYLFGLVQQ